MSSSFGERKVLVLVLFRIMPLYMVWLSEPLRCDGMRFSSATDFGPKNDPPGIYSTYSESTVPHSVEQSKRFLWRARLSRLRSTRVFAAFSAVSTCNPRYEPQIRQFLRNKIATIRSCSGRAGGSRI
ncbi:hypothetical protein DFJ77DRAFT_131798 [Powellomyces hirtus]|nr:hypothetical protein DFJ77DRAFT_131798 [Powellomyces hirtus]